MKRFILTIALVFSGLSLFGQSDFTVGQFNIRYNNPKDVEKGAAWADRLPRICNMINYHGWDLFGAQEVLHGQLQDLLEGLDGYDYVGVGRNDGDKKGEYAPIFYKKSRMKCLQSGHFWISETPDVVGSKGWDANQCRICTWAEFEDNNTKWRFWVFNLHMDHRGVVARREGAKLVLSKIREMCGDQPYILTGDFNVDQNNEIYSILTGSGQLIDTYHSAQKRMAETGSMNYFNPSYSTDSRIDHVFVSPRFKTHEYGVLAYHYWVPIEISRKAKKAIAEGVEGVTQHEMRVLSDHYPVEVRVELPRLRSPQDWANYGYYAEDNANVKDAKVVFMGNSITRNWYKYHPEFFKENSYVGRGISGQVTAQMLARFRADVINLKPETVVILAGTNDIAMNQGYVSIEHIYENIISMAELAKCNGISVVLCSVLPADRYSWSWEIDRERAVNSIRQLNEMLKAYADTHGHEYADYFSAMTDGNDAMKKEYQQDAVHPNKAGYLVMEEVIQSILNK